ncbi:MAG: response regulator [Eubacteriales bacterium]
MSKRILLCDDSAFIRMMAKDILTKGGYEIAGEASDGKQAVEQYDLLKPDLVLMDTVMPGTDGIQAIRLIKQKDGNACLIACVNRDDRTSALDAVKSGACNYVTKPLQKEVLLAVVDKYLK